ncbi:heptaprenyl diphosphate synthase component 1 [Niallia taxi]|uniref:heptaprenyl diphosphate synthase component 1 n=1 Tax=Niallia taxi TaxID=2499688 RepID=UPI001245ABC3|nr:heptaprenyl diphosphate synthase component 1 [Niallia taxi]MDK8639839.1 heptaprenyl diphosphate synthase component 1 [Niallia taxi]MED4040436.1 heptaprenyl diphosphate synthase component 1 [Niallia taxi]MED4055381.1 heptaprenyl diphosphate synthase component 1 [Niallia taxi]MED4117572.1 heptaprenyl diphosphate synthase component 1 [Niallia taxi]
MMLFQEMVEMVREEVLQKIAHPYLFKHIDNPVIDEDKLLLTVFLLKQADLNDSQVITYATTKMLIQIALDTHELVTNDSVHKGIEKNRQLTILAGDFYSGQYYKLLADLEDYEMIKVFAEAIKEVNENKMIIYQQAFAGLSEMREAIVAVEFSILEKLIDRFRLDNWKNFALSFLFLNRMLQDRNTYNLTGNSFLFNRLTKHSEELARLAEENKYLLFDPFIQEATDMLTEALTSSKNVEDSITARTTAILDKIKQQMYVEEG